MARSEAKKKRPAPIRQWLERQCGSMRRHIEVRQLATPEEIAEVWPRNKKPSLILLVRTYGYCRVWVARQDTDPTRVEAAEERMLDALNEEPRQLRLPISGELVSGVVRPLDESPTVLPKELIYARIPRLLDGAD